MSKGNMFMGYAKGKVGSVVFGRSKGQQVTRSYNDAPKNPRSTKQMLQRAIFCSAVKFFQQGNQNFFKFAFENKTIKESDYNAFMRENAKRGQYISKAAYNEQTYPVIAPFMMTKGSLPELDYTANSGGTYFQLALAGITTSSKWGDVSSKLISTYGLADGDILTLCIITAQGSIAENTPAVEPAKRERISWDIVQATIDSASTSAVADVLGSVASVAADTLVIRPTDGATMDCGSVMTVSRQTSEGLKVSDAYLQLNGIATTINTAANEESYISQVMTSWGATGEAILQGSLVQVG